MVQEQGAKVPDKIVVGGIAFHFHVCQLIEESHPGPFQLLRRVLQDTEFVGLPTLTDC